MKHALKIVVLFCLSIGLGVYARSTPRTHGVKGTVLHVSENSALISKRLDLEESDLQLTHEEWLSGNYELLQATPIKDLEPGDQVKVVISELNEEEYPLQATLKRFHLLK